MSVKIKRAELTDIKKVAVLFDAYRVFYRKKSDIEGAIKFLDTRVRNNESVIYVAENEDNELVGFTQLFPMFSSTNMKRVWLLNDLFVDLKARGLGVSKLLMNAAKELSIKTEALGFCLETEKSNEIGNNLYKSYGMTLNDDHNFYYWDNE